MKITTDYVLFWGGEFSNWATIPEGINYVDQETAEIIVFKTSEHLFMYLKAMYFNDIDTAQKIIKAETPKDAKKLGRKVKNFVESEWNKVREEIMYTVVSFKAAAWPLFKQLLLKYKTQHFVEASPYDKIWGIGLGENDPDATDETKWPGLNLLGKTLDKLRDNLLK